MYLSATVFKLFVFLRGVPFLTPSFDGNPLHPLARNFVTINYRDLGAAHSEDFVILACTVLTQITSVTDRQTDRQRLDDGRHAKHSAFARKKQGGKAGNGERNISVIYYLLS